MTPTLEEVKQVADTIYFPSSTGGGWVELTLEELQAFAQHYIEVGEKRQREKDARLFEIDPSMENFSFIASAIRNNTGE